MLNIWAYLGKDISVRHPKLGSVSCSGLEEDYKLCLTDAQLTMRYARCEELKQTGKLCLIKPRNAIFALHLSS